jgi:site-specific recombinase XerC
MKISSWARALAWPTYSCSIFGRSARSSAAGLSARTAARRLSALRQFHRFLLPEEVLDS